MAMEKDCKAVTTLSGTEYIRALAEDGSTVRIPVAELGKVMAQVMPLATDTENGVFPKMCNILMTQEKWNTKDDWIPFISGMAFFRSAYGVDTGILGLTSNYFYGLIFLGSSNAIKIILIPQGEAAQRIYFLSKNSGNWSTTSIK